MKTTSEEIQERAKQYRRLKNPNPDQIAVIALAGILDTMYGDGPDTEWDSDTTQEIAETLHAHGLIEEG